MTKHRNFLGWMMACGVTVGVSLGGVPIMAGEPAVVPGGSGSPMPVLHTLQHPPAPSAPAGVANATAAAASSNDRLKQVLERAMQELDAQRHPELQGARERLRQAIEELESFVGTREDGGQAWARFLKLDQLKAQLDSQQPDIDTLVDLEMNMRQNYLGLEYPQFVRVRQGINEVVRAFRYGSAPQRTLEQLRARMAALVDSLDEPAEGSGATQSSAVGLIANYLHESGQVPWAVAEIRDHYRVPNLRFYAHENFLNRVLGRGVAEPRPVNECLLGTRLIGTACMLGDVNVDLQPMVGGISLSLNMSATMTSNNKGYNRGVVLRSSGVSPVFASKQVIVTPQGISSTPATVATNLQTQIHSIEHRLRLVRKIARKKAAQQKPLADAIAEGRLQTRVRSQYDEQVDQQLADANVRLAAFRNQPRPALPRFGIPRPDLDLHSSNEAVHGDVIQAADFQLAAPAPSTLAKPAGAGVVLEAHQSVVVNALDIAVGGRVIRSADLDDYVRQFVGDVPADLVEEAAGEPWSITMATYHPVEMDLDEGRVQIQLRISSMTRGDQTLADPALITATYLPRFEDGRLILARQGEVSIDFARVSRGLRAVTLRSFLKGKFDRLFKEEIRTLPIDLTETFPNASEVAFGSFTIDDGWLQIAVQ